MPEVRGEFFSWLAAQSSVSFRWINDGMWLPRADRRCCLVHISGWEDRLIGYCSNLKLALPIFLAILDISYYNPVFTVVSGMMTGTWCATIKMGLVDKFYKRIVRLPQLFWHLIIQVRFVIRYKTCFDFIVARSTLGFERLARRYYNYGVLGY